MNGPAEFMRDAQGFGLALSHVNKSGAIQRVPVEGDRPSQRNGWYAYHIAAVPWAVYGNWKTGEQRLWRGQCDQHMSAKERARMTARERQCRREQKQRQAALYMQARGEALKQFKSAWPAAERHPYLAHKQVGVHGIRQLGSRLVVPMCDEKNHLWSLQFIDEGGTKRFLTGGRTRDMFHLIGDANSRVICIAEGYATAASVHEATGYAVAVAFSANNLQSVAVAMRRRFGRLPLVVCADDDAATATRIGTNPGLEAAVRAAELVGGTVAVPPRDGHGTSSKASELQQVQAERGR